VSRTDAKSVRAASEIDPTYAETLSEVAANGVEVIAYGGDITPEGFSLSRRVPVEV
jgi:sugar fermentation stimulation protein A